MDRFEAGARATWLGVRVTGDLAGPLPDEPAADDVFTGSLLTAEAMGGYRIDAGAVRVTPYLGLGFTGVGASLRIGEDLVDVPGANPEIAGMLYRGPHAEVGAQVRYHRLDAALEAYMVPTDLVDPGNPRFFFSPRLRVGYTFF
jgi:hypothetical protein